jgi:hypothetical protein
MKTAQGKKGVIKAFEAIVSELSAREVEDLQDKLTVQLHRLTDDGIRYSLDEVKKRLPAVK